MVGVCWVDTARGEGQVSATLRRNMVHVLCGTIVTGYSVISDIPSLALLMTFLRDDMSILLGKSYTHLYVIGSNILHNSCL